MKKRLWAIIRTAFMIVSAVSLCGCLAVVAAGGAAGGIAYVKGDLQVTEDAPIVRVGQAAEAALRELQFAVIERRLDSLTGHYVARTARDKKVVINLEAAGAMTLISIRVGTFGDEHMSHIILAKIRENL